MPKESENFTDALLTLLFGGNSDFSETEVALEDEPDEESKEYDGFQLYRRDIDAYPLCTREEERAMGLRSKKGDNRARTRLILGNLRLVVHIAKSFSWSCVSREDLVAEGNIGLMRAAAKYDPDAGASFGSYASWWIKQSMRRCIANTASTIRIPVQARVKKEKLSRFTADFLNKNGREPTLEEQADGTSSSSRAVAALHSTVQDVVPIFGVRTPRSLYSLYHYATTSFPVSSQPSDVSPMEVTGCLLADAMREVLEPRETLIIKARYGIDWTPKKTLEELSGVLGVTRERVRQLQLSAEKKLRDFLRAPDTLLIPVLDGETPEVIPAQVPPFVPDQNHEELLRDEVKLAVVECLDECGHSMTIAELLRALSENFPKMYFDESYIRRCLHTPLVTRGSLGNRIRAYRLKEWDLEANAEQEPMPILAAHFQTEVHDLPPVQAPEERFSGGPEKGRSRNRDAEGEETADVTRELLEFFTI